MTNHHASPHELSLSPADILSGLGGANRELLATCLALFDDSQWQRRIEKINQQATNQLEQLGNRVEEWIKSRRGESLPRLPVPQVEEGARELSERQRYWLESGFCNEQLRLLYGYD